MRHQPIFLHTSWQNIASRPIARFFAGLADLEEDLRRHIHLENSVLCPAAQKMPLSG